MRKRKRAVLVIECDSENRPVTARLIAPDGKEESVTLSAQDHRRLHRMITAPKDPGFKTSDTPSDPPSDPPPHPTIRLIHSR